MARTKKKSSDQLSELAPVAVFAAQPGSLALEGELTIYQVAEIKSMLCDALAAAKAAFIPLRLNLAALTECDGAGLQLLLALAKAGKAAKVQVELQNMPGNIAAMIDSYGVAAYFSTATGGDEK